MSINVVCAECIGEPDLQEWIKIADGPPGCDACERSDAPTCKLDDLCDHMAACLHKHWDMADNNLGYCTAEGGYLGATTWITYELLREEVELELPRDHRDTLFSEMLHRLPDYTWCQIDPYRLATNVAMSMSWDKFCQTIKYERRFFFHDADEDGDDSYAPISLLHHVAELADQARLIATLDVGNELWRVGRDTAEPHIAADFGPPPPERALQSNRMNPAGIPMMYLASSAQTALQETRQETANVGRWLVTRPLRVLDLRALPCIPGYFSDEHRNFTLGIRFLHNFCRSIMQPVDRDERYNIDYLPSQVATEFFRYFDFEDGRIDGVAYGSTVGTGWNVVLFASRADVGIGNDPDKHRVGAQWLSFSGAEQVTIRAKLVKKSVHRE
ncbi:hypothetical protein FHR55_003520 [Xanthomonas arboricola]